MPEFANTYPAAPHRFDEASVQRYREHEGEIDDEHDAARCYEAEEGRDAEFGPLSCRILYYAIAIVALVCAVVIVI